ncbi:hypothetical protein RF11_10180 [Thelohanellus kitauei]|uniref:Uncharacterized protein n=1 Tax=Thelohanellus kitauei TaxID=669202 RepID=A0A0C2N3S2_THEKT|nr:hypothetical protein RF11_10180 [Thelohanellus kitauei]
MASPPRLGRPGWLICEFSAPSQYCKYAPFLEIATQLFFSPSPNPTSSLKTFKSDEQWAQVTNFDTIETQFRDIKLLLIQKAKIPVFLLGNFNKVVANSITFSVNDDFDLIVIYFNPL